MKLKSLEEGNANERKMGLFYGAETKTQAWKPIPVGKQQEDEICKYRRIKKKREKIS